MPNSADILVIGGGIAGLSAAAQLARDFTVAVLEAEEHIGFHASGRSATMLHYALGDSVVRSLTQASRPFFDSPPEEVDGAPLGQRMAVLVYAREDERAALDGLEGELRHFASLDRLDEQGIRKLCPLLKTGEGGAQHAIADRNGIRLDPHALLQWNLRQLKDNDGTLATGGRIVSAERQHGVWKVQTDGGNSYSAGILVNAAGAWADAVADLAGVGRLGLQPKRRTIITFDAPAGTELDGLPFAKTVGDELYFAPESGRLFASPMDEVPSDPCDAQPDELEVALAAHRVEERTTIQVHRIHSRWAGLRTFTPDRRPAVGFDRHVEGFFWLAGQGGFGLQTSPALARAAHSLISGATWPLEFVREADLSPARFGAEASSARFGLARGGSAASC